MLECRRNEKEYDWMSDVFIPEYPSMYLTEMSRFGNQYFASRDFTDVYLEGVRPEDKQKSKAYKTLINKSLNIQDIYHYQKYMRAMAINSTAGEVYALCRWDLSFKSVDAGQQMFNEETGEYEPEKIDVIINDHFNYDVIDSRNVFTDNSYVYSLQDKKYIIIRDEK